MKKNLLKRIGMKTILPLAFAVGLGSCQPHYNEKLTIGKNRVYFKTNKKRGFTMDWDVKEKKKDGTVIKYDIEPDLNDNPKKFDLDKVAGIKIKGEKGYYNYEDSVEFPVWKKGNERVKFLINRYYFVRDSTRQANGLKALE